MTISDIDTIVAQCANAVFRRFYSSVERADLVSEGHLWVQEHQSRLDHYMEDAQDDPRRADYRLRRDITTAMEIFARSEKAAQAGYSPSDEYFYTEAMLNLFLPAVLFDDHEPPKIDDESPRSVQDPAEGNNWLAMLADVRRAWELADLSPDECVALVMRHVERDGDKPKPYTEIGDRMGVSWPQARRIHQGAVRRIMGILGGDKPQRECPNDCACHEGPLRIRPGVRSRLSGADQLLS